MAKQPVTKTYNNNIQTYKGIKLKLIIYTPEHFARLRAKRFLLVGKNKSQNIWIPNRHLDPSGTILPGENLDYIMLKAYEQNKFQYAGIPFNPEQFQ